MHKNHFLRGILGMLGAITMILVLTSSFVGAALEILLVITFSPLSREGVVIFLLLIVFKDCTFSFCFDFDLSFSSLLERY